MWKINEHLPFYVYQPKAGNKCFVVLKCLELKKVGKVKPKVKALQHVNYVTVLKIDAYFS